MRILSLKPDHNGGYALVDTDSQSLVFCYESEKYSDVFLGSNKRHTPSRYTDLLHMLEEVPDVDVIALSGWNRDGAGYFGHETVITRKRVFLGKEITYFSSSHERSHLMCAMGLSPYSPEAPCYCLLWEGYFGNFYFINGKKIIKIGEQIVNAPGMKYSRLFNMAANDPPDRPARYTLQAPGKLMALLAYANSDPVSELDRLWVNEYIDTRDPHPASIETVIKKSSYVGAGVQDQKFINLAKFFSDTMFQRFESVATKAVAEHGKHPLLVIGGCGLNCDWNSRWKDSGLFTDVFVPPCPDDTGSSIGTAIDAMWHIARKPKLRWNVYSGYDFKDEPLKLPAGVIYRQLDLSVIASLLFSNNVIAWVQGRSEIGPRSLGNRSLFMSPLRKEHIETLNTIKNREPFRPVAPVCLEEDVSLHFDWQGPSPYMLFFQKVLDSRLSAITHVDGTARVQTVSRRQNDILYDLLVEFKKLSGVGVLCNTSLNYPGKGFIGQTLDLYNFCKLNKIKYFVINNSLYEIPDE